MKNVERPTDGTAVLGDEPKGYTRLGDCKEVCQVRLGFKSFDISFFAISALGWVLSPIDILFFDFSTLTLLNAKCGMDANTG